MENKKEEIKFSPRAVCENMFGKAEKNKKSARATKRANKKTSKKGKYIVKYDIDGVKHMILR